MPPGPCLHDTISWILTMSSDDNDCQFTLYPPGNWGSEMPGTWLQFLGPSVLMIPLVFILVRESSLSGGDFETQGELQGHHNLLLGRLFLKNVYVAVLIRWKKEATFIFIIFCFIISRKVKMEQKHTKNEKRFVCSAWRRCCDWLNASKSKVCKVSLWKFSLDDAPWLGELIQVLEIKSRVWWKQSTLHHIGDIRLLIYIKLGLFRDTKTFISRESWASGGQARVLLVIASPEKVNDWSDPTWTWHTVSCQDRWACLWHLFDLTLSLLSWPH